MIIVFKRQSNDTHTVRVVRDDGTTDVAELNSRSFLRHDLAHFAVEAELRLSGGYWGSVAGGASLGGEGVEGSEALLAEQLAGPVQTLMRTDAPVDEFLIVLERAVESVASAELARRIHGRIRSLRGHWQAMPFHGEMRLRWPPD